MQKVLHNIFYCHMINIKNLDLNIIKIDENSYNNIFIIIYIGYSIVKDLSYAKSNTADQLYPIIN